MNKLMFKRTGGYSGQNFDESSKDRIYFSTCYTSTGSTRSLCYKYGLDDDYDVLVKSSSIPSKGDIDISYYKPSRTNGHLAFQYNRNGSDWKEIRIVKVKKRRSYSEIIKHTKSSNLHWLRNGFFYEKFPFDSLRAKTQKPAIMYHKIDSSPSDDILIFKSRRESDYISMYGAPDESFFIIKKENIETHIFSYFYLDAIDNDLNFKPFLMNIKYDLEGFNFKENQIYATTYLDDKKQVISIPKNEPTKFKVVSAVYDGAIFLEFRVLEENILSLYLTKEGNLFSLVDRDGRVIKETKTPNGLSVDGMSYNTTFKEFFFYLQSFTIPSVLYKLDLDTFNYDLINQTKVGFDPKGYKFIKKTFTSKDGAEVPITIVYKDSLSQNSVTPFLMSTYGGYGSVSSSSYDPGIVYFIENGGAFAYDDIRGSGTLGKQWWEKGKGLNKQNGIQDFISAAEFLIEQKYTAAKKIAIRGSSHGGLIIAASVVKRPDLFGAAEVNVGALDMLRLSNFTVGATPTNILEFGDVENQQDFDNLYSYSPYHNIDNTVNYPSMLITTGLYDNRVPPLHSFKFAARLQNNPSQEHPILLWTQKRTGHFGAINMYDKLEENCYIYGFLFDEL